ncbi:MAG TPA: metal ABC transporter ATP-binding protein [Acidimicrobiales bacterium]|nr:metal ABC transporter ATP-binding protein [Acidimicrobiales bacterium]
MSAGAPGGAARDAPVVSLRAVEARVGGARVWSGVDLAVAPGELVAVLGPNGAGKSTLLKVILGLVAPAAGTVEVLGGPPAAARRSIGYLPQRRTFEAGLPVRGVDLVRLGLDGDRYGVPLPGLARLSARARRAAARVAAAVERVGASAYAGRPIGQLSGGEQQRLLIAQALVREPRLLLLDEPLDGLDLPNQSAIAALLGSICEAGDVTVLIVAHDINPILPFLDRVVYLARGAAASGRPEEVVTSATLSRLFGAPIEVLRASDGRLVVVGEPEPPALHVDRHAHGPRP